jgi:hypothetical protein
MLLTLCVFHKRNTFWHISDDFATSMMLPTIDEDNQVLFNIEGNIEECTRCYDHENTSFHYIHDDCENQKMPPNVHKENQEFSDFEWDIKRDNDSDSHSKWKWIAGIFLILFLGSAAISTCMTAVFLILFVGSAAIFEVTSISWKSITARYLRPRI